ncbi:undecaprenyl diphosphate synthase family protein, partial [Candidatus Woesearchaeota archaeon]|nr:undecaprenyl diphosphate synthase family protein [Candidatus Woesearchaeota archaeon]
MVLKKLGELFSITLHDVGRENVPKHLLITLEESEKDEEIVSSGKNQNFFEKRNTTVISIIETQAKIEIPVVTIQLLSSRRKSAAHLTAATNAISELLEELSKAEVIHANQIKVAVLGKWYDLPSRLVDAVKSAVDATADYDRFFLNLCVQYNGQQEIVD